MGGRSFALVGRAAVVVGNICAVPSLDRRVQVITWLEGSLMAVRRKAGQCAENCGSRIIR